MPKMCWRCIRMKGRCENIFSFSFGMCEDVQRCMDMCKHQPALLCCSKSRSRIFFTSASEVRKNACFRSVVYYFAVLHALQISLCDCHALMSQQAAETIKVKPILQLLVCEGVPTCMGRYPHFRIYLYSSRAVYHHLSYGFLSQFAASL